MAIFTKFEGIIAWQKARELCKLFDACIKRNPILAQNFKLKDQMDASSGSVMDNIAEGFGRMGNGEFVHFLTIASASAREFQSQLYRAFDKELISEEERQAMQNLADEICRIISSLIKNMQQSDNRGYKFKKG